MPAPILIAARLVGYDLVMFSLKTGSKKLDGNIKKKVLKAGTLVADSARDDQMGGVRTKAFYQTRRAKSGAWRTRKRKGSVTAKKHQLGLHTKKLQKSIKVRSKKLRMGKYEISVGPRREYAAIHEFGGKFMAFGKHPTVMPKRPYLKPAIKATRDRVFKLIGESFTLSFS